jgi:hypothetical protein
MGHLDKPQTTDDDAGLRERALRLEQSDYVAHVRRLAPRVKGRVVSGTIGGTSGFTLLFEDGTWVACFLQADRLAYRCGEGRVPAEVLTLLSSPDYASGHAPLGVDLPYATEPCVISEQLAKAEGQPVLGLAYGEHSFNFCFPADMELDTMIQRDAAGRVTLRVFWEQW